MSKRAGMFLRSSVFDYLIVLVVSAALVFTVSYGFNSAPDLRQNMAFIGTVCAVLLLPLYAGGWSRRAVPVAAAAYVVLAVGVVALAASLSPEAVDLFVDGQVNDVESNYAVFGIVCVVVPLIVYLLSRRTWGVAALFFFGVLACGTIQFLYRDWISSQPGTVAALVAYTGMGALFMVQGYREGVLKSRIVKKTSFFGAFAFGVVGSLACLGVGALVFLGVISGLGLETVSAKPFEDYFSRPVVEYDGTYRQQEVIDPDLGTSRLSDDEEDTISDAEGYEDENADENTSGGVVFVEAIADMLDIDNWNEMFDAVRVDLPPSLLALIVLLPIALIVALVLLRRHVRVWRLNKLSAKPVAIRVAYLYGFFMKRFKRLKIERAPTLTPLEFALASSRDLAAFSQNASNTDFLGVTLLYQRVVYGAANVTEEDYSRVVDYYSAFFRHARERVGAVKWLWLFWRI